MELFRKLMFGTSDDQRPPIISTVKNELGGTELLDLYAYSTPLSYNFGFFDLREAVSEDGGTIKGAEIYMSNILIETFYFNSPATQYFFKQIYQGTNIFKLRVFDDLGQFSLMSDEIIYNVKPFSLQTQHEWVENSSVGNYSKNIHIKIKDFRTLFLYNNQANTLINIYIDFELVYSPGTSIPIDAVYTTLVHANRQTPTALVFNQTNNWGGSTPKITLDIGKTNPNELNKWITSGLLGFKLLRENSGPEVGMKITFRTKDINNVTNLTSYSF